MTRLPERRVLVPPHDRSTQTQRLAAGQSIAEMLLDLLAVAAHLGELLAGITDLAIETVPACESASITVIHQTIPSTAASFDARARRIDEGQYSDGQGPCLRAARTGETVQIDDISTTSHTASSPTWRRVAREAHVTASLSIPLTSTANIEAALNLYTTQTGGWISGTYDAAELLATYSGDALTIAYRIGAQDPQPHYWPYDDTPEGTPT